MSTTQIQTVPPHLEHLFKTRLGKPRLHLVGSSNEASQPNGVQVEVDLVKLLGPGNALGTSLLDFTQAYVGTSQAFNSLLNYPYLEKLKVGGSPFADADLRSLLLNGYESFHIFASQESSTARDLTALSSLYSDLLAGRTVNEFAHLLGPMITKYATKVVERSNEKERTLTKFSTSLTLVDKTITRATAQLREIADQIELRATNLESTTIAHALERILRPVFTISRDGASAITQLTFLLSLNATLLHGNFKKLFADTDGSQVLVACIRDLCDQFLLIKSNLNLLTASLSISIDAGIYLSTVWSQISYNLGKLIGQNVRLSDSQVYEISNEWVNTRDQASRLLEAISGAPYAARELLAGDAPYQTTPSYPDSKPLLKIMKLVENAEGNPYITSREKFNVMKNMAKNRAVHQRLTEKLLQSMISEGEASENSLATGDVKENAVPDEKTFVFDFGAPDDVRFHLEKLNGECKVVVQKFDDILKFPYLDSLQVDNPFVNATLSVNGQSDPEPAKIDIRTMVIRYRALYLNLQTESVGLIRDLITYSSAQLILLPAIKVGGTPGPGQISLAEYSAANDSLITEYSDRTNLIHGKYIVFNQDWHLAQLSLEKSINEAEQNVQTNLKLIEDMSKEQKSKQLWGILEALGAMALFAVGCFTLPLGLLAIGGAGALLYMSVNDLQAAGKLDEAIGTYKNALNTAQETSRSLKVIKEPMEAVAKAVIEITEVFLNISLKLASILSHITLWNLNANLFPVFLPKALIEWQETQDLCVIYIQFISGG